MGINGSKKISAALFLDLVLDGVSFSVVWKRELENSKQYKRKSFV